MLLINNIPLQQTFSTETAIIFIVIFILIIIVAVVGISELTKETKEKDKWIKHNSDKLKIQDDFILKFISPLSLLTPKCNKCNNHVYQIWWFNKLQLTIRCDECKKKYNIDLVEDSKIAIDSLIDYIDFVQECYSHSNEKLKEYLINKLSFNFSLLRSNQPIIRAIVYKTSSDKIAASSRLNFKLIGYTNYLSFNENEYYEVEDLDLNDLEGQLSYKYNEYSELILNAFKDNPDKNEVFVQFPAMIMGVQKQVTYHRNGVPEIKRKEIDYMPKKSRRISQDVKDKVWRRDEGKCVECGSNFNLEFDHIIPFSKGGANTYRNIQLLCESCNRSKSDKLG